MGNHHVGTGGDGQVKTTKQYSIEINSIRSIKVFACSPFHAVRRRIIIMMIITGIGSDECREYDGLVVNAKREGNRTKYILHTEWRRTYCG